VLFHTDIRTIMAGYCYRACFIKGNQFTWYCIGFHVIAHLYLCVPLLPGCFIREREVCNEVSTCIPYTQGHCLHYPYQSDGPLICWF
jgi:hypothetical protein